MPEPILLPNGVTVVGKPSPRVCIRCRTKTVGPATVPYRASRMHEGARHTVDVPPLSVPRCETCGELHFDNYADDRINAAFRAQLGLLTPAQVRANREALGLSQDELAARLGVTAEPVRRWEEDLQIPTRVEDNLLRLDFALPQVRSVLAGAGAGSELGTAVDY